MTKPLDPDDLAYHTLLAYRSGIFPMANAREDEDLFWVDPDFRGQLPILDLHIPSRLARTVRARGYRVTVDTAFPAVIDSCADAAENRPESWINPAICSIFVELHRQGYAHSVEVWRGDELVGGLYGLALGQIFCGESMFSRARDASKVALVHLCARLYTGGFQVLDAQFVNEHLKQFGVYEIARADYHDLLARYADQRGDFTQPERSESAILASYFQARKKGLNP